MLKTSHKRSYRVAMRPNTSSCCHSKSAALSNVAWLGGLIAVPELCDIKTFNEFFYGKISSHLR